MGLFYLRRNKIPWQPSDAPRHTKKANTSAKKKKWASIANSVLADCLKAGRSQKVCEGRAVRIANSKLEEIMKWTDEDIKRHDEYFEATKDRKKPGGSSAGKYPGVKVF